MNTLEFRKLPQASYPVNEAFNTLSTNISFLGRDTKKLMLTSSHASEGKSFTSLSLARKLAERGKRVVLVDTDLRRSRIVSTYGVKFPQDSKKYGLSHYLAGIAEQDEVLYKTNVAGMDFVPVGRELLNPLPLLVSNRFQALLDRLAEAYDYVIVDAAPVGVVIDAAEIAKYCDGILLVVSYNQVHRQELIEAKAQLEHSGCPILGTILNQVDYDGFTSKKYYYKSHYSNYYKAYEKGADEKGADEKKKG